MYDTIKGHYLLTTVFYVDVGKWCVFIILKMETTIIGIAF